MDRTNGLSRALELEPAVPRFTVIVTGGSLRHRQHSPVERLATSVLGHLHAGLTVLEPHELLRFVRRAAGRSRGR